MKEKKHRLLFSKGKEIGCIINNTFCSFTASFIADVSGITEEALMNHYKSTFSRVFPFPWSESVHGTAREVYTPLDIVDSAG